MIQLRAFKLPEQEQAANEFLAHHKPARDGIQFNTDSVFIFFDDGTVPVEYAISGWQEYLQGALTIKQQQQSARAVLLFEITDLTKARDLVNPLKNQEKWNALAGQITQTEHAVAEADKSIAIQDAKIEFITGNIADLQASVK